MREQVEIARASRDIGAVVLVSGGDRLLGWDNVHNGFANHFGPDLQERRFDSTNARDLPHFIQDAAANEGIVLTNGNDSTLEADHLWKNNDYLGLGAGLILNSMGYRVNYHMLSDTPLRDFRQKEKDNIVRQVRVDEIDKAIKKYVDPEKVSAGGTGGMQTKLHVAGLALVHGVEVCTISDGREFDLEALSRGTAEATYLTRASQRQLAGVG